MAINEPTSINARSKKKSLETKWTNFAKSNLFKKQENQWERTMKVIAGKGSYFWPRWLGMGLNTVGGVWNEVRVDILPPPPSVAIVSRS
jgi:hypothetical protein